MPAFLEPDFASTRVVSVRLSTSPSAPWLARQLMAQWCREWRLPERVVDDAVLVVSELVTAQFDAGVGSVDIGARVAEPMLEVSVGGPVSRMIRPQGGGQDDVSVRSAEVVDGVAAWVDVRLEDTARTVVVAIPLRRAP